MTYYSDLLDIMHALEAHGARKPIERPAELISKCRAILADEPHEIEATKLLAILTADGSEDGQSRHESTSLPPVDDSRREALINNLRVQTFSRLARPAAIGLLIGALAVNYVLRNDQSAIALNIWVGAFVAISVLRMIWASKHYKRDLAPEQAALHSNVIIVIAAAFGCLWGALPLLPGIATTGTPAIVLIIAETTVLASSVTIYHVRPPASTLFAVLIGLPLIWACYQYEPVMGIVAVLYLIWLMVSIKAHEGQFTQTITALRALHEERDNLELALRGTSHETRQWIWSCDSQLRLQDCDPGLAKALQTTMKAANGKPLVDLLAGSTLASSENAQLEALVMQLQLHRSFSGVTLNINSDNNPRRWIISAVARNTIEDEFSGYKGVIRALDLSFDPSQTQYHDDDSRLPGYSWLHPHIEGAIAAAAISNTHCALIQLGFLNADEVSNTRGIVGFEASFSRIADTIKASKPDALCAHLGRERFLILLPYVPSKGDAQEYATAILNALDAEFRRDETPPAFIAGIALSRNQTTTSIIKEQADTAYSGAVPNSSQRMRFYQLRRAQPISIDAALTALGPALRDQHIRLRYDAVFDVENRAATFLRLHLSWDHYNLGPIDENTIIRMVMGRDDHHNLSNYVIHTCLRAALRVANGATVALPASFIDMNDPKIQHKLANAAASAAAKPSQIKILIADPQTSQDQITKLGMAGLRIGSILNDPSMLPSMKNGFISSIWMPAETLKHRDERVKGLPAQIRDVIATDAKSLVEHDEHASLGFTAITGMARTNQMSGDEATFFTSLAVHTTRPSMKKAG